ncbi:MAG: hypothetical protein AAFY08_03105 [Planctomycetota bacterium]
MKDRAFPLWLAADSNRLNQFDRASILAARGFSMLLAITLLTSSAWASDPLFGVALSLLFVAWLAIGIVRISIHEAKKLRQEAHS